MRLNVDFPLGMELLIKQLYHLRFAIGKWRRQLIEAIPRRINVPLQLILPGPSPCHPRSDGRTQALSQLQCRRVLSQFKGGPLDVRDRVVCP